MDMHKSIYDLPPGAREFLSDYLSSHSMQIDDPVAASAILQAKIIKSERRKYVFAGFLALATGLAGYFAGNSNGLSEAYKARPMVEISTPGSSIVYGTMGPRQIVRIKSVEGVWEKNGDGFVTIHH